MAKTNYERIGEGLNILREGLISFVERECLCHLGEDWKSQLKGNARYTKDWKEIDGQVQWDISLLLKTMWDQWNKVFSHLLSRTDRSLVNELREIRNRWAHQNQFSSNEAYRALDSMYLLCKATKAVSASRTLENLLQDTLRLKFSEQSRQATKTALQPVKGRPQRGLAPWRDIIVPHRDVASGNYQKAEFAADIGQVRKGMGMSEYKDPEEFFKRTYLTDGLKELIRGALKRFSGQSAEPIIELQTNFGGGKTHSMLALFHLTSGTPLHHLLGIEDICKELNISSLEKVRKAVFVGTDFAPASPEVKEDGTPVHTIWGEIAWQLGGKEAYTMLAESDKKGTSPGTSCLQSLFNKFGPSLILIDEWIAFVRELYKKDGKDALPAGSFESNFTFAQSLTEAVRQTSNTLLVASLPASDIETGGSAGQEALKRLKNVFGRMQTPWRPATPEEGFEIVRRRLFEPITDNQKHKERDAVIDNFCNMYYGKSGDFPSSTAETAYKKQMQSAYPIHPEVLERLYMDWGALDRFQRTRGVLRLMASVVHHLWDTEDKSLMILPSSLPLSSDLVRDNLVHFLEEPQTWSSVISTDVDGSHALSNNLDKDFSRLGRLSAGRRVARTIFLGSAPKVGTNNPGLEEARIKLGCVQPGEDPAVFGDALRKLQEKATHLYVDQTRYWFDRKTTVNRLAKERATQFEEYKIWDEVEKRLQSYRKSRSHFAGIHIFPESSADVPDDMELRLVVLHPQFFHFKRTEESPAQTEAMKILDYRGENPRHYRNRVLFLAIEDRQRKSLEEGVRIFLAWQSIEEDTEQLNLDVHQSKLTKNQKKQADEVIEQRIKESFVWSLTPTQSSHDKPLEWNDKKLSTQTQEDLTHQIGRELQKNENLILEYSDIRLRMDLDKYKLWENSPHINTQKVWEYFCSYLYLPRFQSEKVFKKAITGCLNRLTWRNESFAYATGFSEENKEYLGFRDAPVTIDSHSLIIKPDSEFLLKEHPVSDFEGVSNNHEHYGRSTTTEGISSDTDLTKEGGAGMVDISSTPHRFRGRVSLSGDRLKRDLDNIYEEVIRHFSDEVDTQVDLKVEIDAHSRKGINDQKQRAVRENCNTLNFEDYDFEE